jgi:hypothetical protein
MIKGLRVHGKINDHSVPKTSACGYGCTAWRRFFALLGICLGLFVRLEMAHGQTGGSPCVAATALPMAGSRIVNVSTEAQLQNALRSLQTGDTIVLANGIYNLTSTLYVNGVDDVTIRGNSGCDQVVLVGRGMDNANYGSVPHGVWSNARNTVIAHLTIREPNKRHLSTHDGRATLGLLSPHRILSRCHIDNQRFIPTLNMLTDGAPSPDLSIIWMRHDRHDTHAHPHLAHTL